MDQLTGPPSCRPRPASRTPTCTNSRARDRSAPKPTTGSDPDDRSQVSRKSHETSKPRAKIATSSACANRYSTTLKAQGPAGAGSRQVALGGGRCAPFPCFNPSCGLPIFARERCPEEKPLSKSYKKKHPQADPKPGVQHHGSRARPPKQAVPLRGSKTTGEPLLPSWCHPQFRTLSRPAGRRRKRSRSALQFPLHTP
jgi:hypothetical protein